MVDLSPEAQEERFNEQLKLRPGHWTTRDLALQFLVYPEYAGEIYFTPEFLNNKMTIVEDKRFKT